MLTDEQYAPGGLRFNAVEDIVERLGCPRSRAIAALRVCDNDVERSIRSLSEPWMLPSQPPQPNSRARRQSTKTHPIPHAVNPEVSSTVPHSGLEVFTEETPSLPQVQQYQLPKLHPQARERPFSPHEGSSQHFSLHRLLWALQTAQLSSADVAQYFSYFPPQAVLDSIGQCVHKVPSIFFAVATNRSDIVRTWIEHGADVNAVDGRYQVPLLAFSILLSLVLKEDTTPIVLLLLTHGANACTIPLTEPQTASKEGAQNICDTEDQKRGSASEIQRWCSDFFWTRLELALNSTQRYFLLRAQTYKQPSRRALQAAASCNVTGLFSLPYCIVGQDLAIKLLTDRILSHFVVPTFKPLVLLFAGPSGHGKTEVGRYLGSLLSLETHVVDMTEVRYETDLFGPKAPFHGCEGGSPLNNFLIAKSGKRAVVMLDEFEKSTKEALNSLLITLDEGRYMDRRQRKTIDCSKIIWILATNALDPVITSFCKNEGMEKVADVDRLEENLQPLLSSAVKAKFGFPFSGRVSTIVPFLPFTADEQVAIAHRYLLRLMRNVRQSISLSNQLVGNVRLRIKKEWALCTALAEECYDADTGARSLESAVKSKLEAPLVREYLASNEDIDEKQPLEEYTVEYSGGRFVIKKTSREE